MSAISWLRLGVRTAFLSAVGAVAISVCGCAVFSGMVSNSNPDWDDPYGPPSGAAVPASAGASAPAGPAARGTYRTQEQVSAPVSPDEKAVIASAQVLMGKAPESHATVNGRTFVLDCIGTVSAIFYGMNIDVQRDFRRYAGDGVSRLYQSLLAHGAVHRDLLPRPGDVIFWDDTWDANGDGNLADDALTHAGVVLSVDPDGTIHYVHEHVIKGVVVESMNLFHPRDYYGPQGRIINNAMAMNSGVSRRDNPAHWTSGDLWDSFGDVLRVRKYFEVAVTVPGAGLPEPVLVALRPPDPQ